VYALVLAWVGPAAAQSAGLLDGLRVAEDGDRAVLMIDLTEPVRYVGHSLSPSGTVLQVRLTRAGGGVIGGATASTGRTSLTPPAAGVGRVVTEITYQGGGGEAGMLTVRFGLAVRPTVSQGTDRRSISIILPLAEITASPAQTAAPTESATPAMATASGAAAEGTTLSPSGDAAAAGVAAEMERARQAMIAKDYAAAVRLLTRIKQSGDPGVVQEAQELLGVAQERSNHLAHAKAEYEEYLRLYPTGEGAERVRQRLAALLGAAPQEANETPPPLAPPPPPPPLDAFLAGSFSQFFRRDSSITDDAGDVFNQSYLANDLDLSGRVRTAEYDVRGLVNGGYRVDIEGSSSGNDLRMRYLYLDATDRRHGVNGRIGRQSLSSGGVLGRFDGALLSYRVTPQVRLNAVGGLPVNLSSHELINTDQYFYGLSMDYGPFAEHWSLNGYAIQQQADAMLDRRAVGGEVRYLRPEMSFFTFIDFDISYLQLNILLAQGTYSFPNAATLTAAVDYRDAPALTTSNALIGQPVESLDELGDLYDEDEIRRLAEDRTQRSWSVSLSGSYPLTDTLQLAADAFVADLSATPASGGVEATPPAGEQWAVTTQLIGTNVLLPRDLQIVGARYTSTDFADTGSLMANSLFLVGEAWRWNPRLQIDFQGRSDGTAAILRPALLVDYRWVRALALELELGYEGVLDLSGSSGGSQHGYFLYVGYRWDFDF
jgi:hypothetical protein